MFVFECVCLYVYFLLKHGRRPIHTRVSTIKILLSALFPSVCLARFSFEISQLVLSLPFNRTDSISFCCNPCCYFIYFSLLPSHSLFLLIGKYVFSVVISFVVVDVVYFG